MDLVVQIYQLVNELPSSERYCLGPQLRKAAVSVPSNIAEGHGRLHKAEFVHHLSIANGSVREVDTQVQIIVRVGHLTAERCQQACTTIDEVGRMLAGLIKAIRRY